MDLSELLITTYVGLQVLLTIFVALSSFGTIYHVTRSNSAMSFSKKSIFKCWFKLTWKMRSIYICVLVHIFDMATDLLVIREWYIEEDKHDIEHIDGTIMVIWSVTVLFLYRIVSSLVIYIESDKDWKDGLLQFCDLLLFIEVRNSHHKLLTALSNTQELLFAVVVTQHNDNNNDSSTVRQSKLKLNNESIESSVRFKHLRSLEALFESTPQAVLQLVYIIRTSQFVSGNPATSAVYIISTAQSIISMTNAMLNADNIYMTGTDWKRYRKRFPIPTKEFLSHAVCRFCEITSRVGILALFWAVVGGEYLGVVLLCELLFPVSYMLNIHFLDKKAIATWTEFFLSLNTIITLPPEWVFEERDVMTDDDCWATWSERINQQCPSCIICLACLIAAPITIIVQIVRFACCHPCMGNVWYKFSGWRLCATGIEWMIIITSHINYDSSKHKYLLSQNHGLGVFYVSIVCFGIFSLFYPLLMPDIRLPSGVPIRSKLGYSYLGNMEELDRLFRHDQDSIVEKIYNEQHSNIIHREEAIMKEINDIERDINQFMNLPVKEQTAILKLDDRETNNRKVLRLDRRLSESQESIECLRHLLLFRQMQQTGIVRLDENRLTGYQVEYMKDIAVPVFDYISRNRAILHRLRHGFVSFRTDRLDGITPVSIAQVKSDVNDLFKQATGCQRIGIPYDPQATVAISLFDFAAQLNISATLRNINEWTNGIWQELSDDKIVLEIQTSVAREKSTIATPLHRRRLLKSIFESRDKIGPIVWKVRRLREEVVRIRSLRSQVIEDNQLKKQLLKQLKQYWDSCIDYAQKNGQTQTVAWLQRRGAVV